LEKIPPYAAGGEKLAVHHLYRTTAWSAECVDAAVGRFLSEGTCPSDPSLLISIRTDSFFSNGETASSPIFDPPLSQKPETILSHAPSA